MYPLKIYGPIAEKYLAKLRGHQRQSFCYDQEHVKYTIENTKGALILMFK